jgi:hypothetical protein
MRSTVALSLRRSLPSDPIPATWEIHSAPCSATQGSVIQRHRFTGASRPSAFYNLSPEARYVCEPPIHRCIATARSSVEAVSGSVSGPPTSEKSTVLPRAYTFQRQTRDPIGSPCCCLLPSCHVATRAGSISLPGDSRDTRCSTHRSIRSQCQRRFFRNRNLPPWQLNEQRTAALKGAGFSCNGGARSTMQAGRRCVVSRVRAQNDLGACFEGPSGQARTRHRQRPQFLLMALPFRNRLPRRGAAVRAPPARNRLSRFITMRTVDLAEERAARQCCCIVHTSALRFR